MQLGAIYRNSDVLIPRAWRATGALDRMRGLLGRPALQRGEAMLIEPCSSVHTVGMAYPLDIAFIDGRGKILKLCGRVRPFRAAFALGTRSTLEMAGGEIARLGLAAGDELQWRN